ncbi:hypothetical protein F5051DRAFT_423005 [Lentinula edodes]|nr:hypothetical protein F5051DRAFT_423005 [Lentinula edodes]
MSAAYSSTLIIILTFFLGVISFPMTLPSHDNQLEARMPPVASARLNNLHLRLMRSSVSSSGEILMVGGSNSKSKSLPIDYNKLTLETWALCIHMDCFTTAIDTKQTDPDKRSVPIFTHFDLPYRKGTKERLRAHDLRAKIDWETAEKKTEYFAKFEAVKFHGTSNFLHGCVTILLQDHMLYTTDEKDKEKKTFLTTVPEWDRLYQAMSQVEGSG